jgi:hypothetical protein
MELGLGKSVEERVSAAKLAAEEDLLFAPMPQALSAESGSGGFGFENIVGVGVAPTIGSERRSDEAAVAVYVARKVSGDRLEAGALVPESYEGVPTKVIESGEFIVATERGRYRPVPLGVSVGHFEGETGTLGFLARRGDELLVVSNNHVLARENQAVAGDPILQPGLADGGQSSDQFAQLATWLPLEFGGERNQVDAAMANVEEGEVSNQQLNGDILAEPAVAVQNCVVRKHGRTTGLTHGVLYDTSATIKLRYPQGMAVLSDQVLIKGLDGKPFSAPGDSGSLVVEDSSNQPLALLCGGSPRFTLASKIQAILEGLGVSWAK